MHWLIKYKYYPPLSKHLYIDLFKIYKRDQIKSYCPIWIRKYF